MPLQMPLYVINTNEKNDIITFLDVNLKRVDFVPEWYFQFVIDMCA